MSLEVPYLDLKELNKTYRDLDLKAMENVLDSGQLIGGAAVNNFEERFARYCGTAHAIGTGNGLDALTLILRAEVLLQNIPANGKILVPAHTYIATFLSIIHAGLQPVPYDTTAITTCVSDIKGFVDQAHGIVVVDIYGKMVGEEVYAFAEANNLPIYCDCAQSHGATTDSGRRAGSLARASAFSFYPTKNLGALGDGGAVTTNSTSLAQKIRRLANYGRVSRYSNDLLGFNSRLDPIQAACLSHRLDDLDVKNNLRIQIARDYFKKITNSKVQLAHPGFLKENVFHVFPIFTDQRDALREHLLSFSIGTSCHYEIPPHKQEALQDYRWDSFPQAEQFHKTELSIPCNPSMSLPQVDHVIDAINKF
ncbi:MAG: DegT/DnrJ/EryC1/StrS family aminotransferase [Nonlabens sp.]